MRRTRITLPDGRGISIIADPDDPDLFEVAEFKPMRVGVMEYCDPYMHCTFADMLRAVAEIITETPIERAQQYDPDTGTWC